MKTLIASLLVTLSLSTSPIGLVQAGDGVDASPQSFCNIAPWMPFFCTKK